MTAKHCQTNIFTVISVRCPCTGIRFFFAAFYAKCIVAALILARQNAVIPFFVIKHFLLSLKIHCRSPYYMLKKYFFAYEIFIISIIINFQFFFNSFSHVFEIFFIFSTKAYKMQTAMRRGLDAFCFFKRISLFLQRRLFRLPQGYTRQGLPLRARFQKFPLLHNITLYAKRRKIVRLFFLYFFHLKI